MKEKALYLINALTSWVINSFGNRKAEMKRILVVKLDEIGDMVTCLHIFDILHRQYPNATIELQCKVFNKVLFKHLYYVIIVDKPKGKYDLILNMRGNWQTVLFAWLHWPKYHLDRGRIRMMRKFKGGQMNELDTNLAVIAPLIPQEVQHTNNKITTSENEEAAIKQFLTEHKIENYALLHVGARDLSRRWPIERFHAVSDYLNKMGIKVLLAGGPSDKPLNQSLVALSGGVIIDTAGRFDLLEFSCLCAKARLFIGNESGPMHIAAAMNTPLIGLFGPGVKDVFYPRSTVVKIHHYFLEKGHKKQTEANSTINRISVEEVIKSIDEIQSIEA